MISKHFFRISGVPDLPEARGKLCASYDPSGNHFTYNYIYLFSNNYLPLKKELFCSKYLLMSLVAHGFGRVEFRTFVDVF